MLSTSQQEMDLNLTQTESNTFYQEAEKLFNDKDYSKSLELFLSIAKEYVKTNNNDNQLLYKCFWQIGKIHLEQKNNSEAYDAIKDAITALAEITTNTNEEEDNQHQEMMQLYLTLGKIAELSNKPNEEIIEAYEKATHYGQSIQSKRLSDYLNLAILHANKGRILINTMSLDKALESYKSAKNIFLTKQQPEQFSSIFSDINKNIDQLTLITEPKNIAADIISNTENSEPKTTNKRKPDEDEQQNSPVKRARWMRFLETTATPSDSSIESDEDKLKHSITNTV